MFRNYSIECVTTLWGVEQTDKKQIWHHKLLPRRKRVSLGSSVNANWDQNKCCILCFKWDLFISLSDNKQRKPAMNFILNDRETAKLETFWLYSILKTDGLTRSNDVSIRPGTVASERKYDKFNKDTCLQSTVAYLY